MKWNQRSRLLIAFLLGFTFIAISACGEQKSQPSNVKLIVATTSVYGNITQAIAGNFFNVESLITEIQQDPHDFQTSAQNQLKVSQAALVIQNGGGYDDFAQRMIDSQDRSKPEVITVADISSSKAENEHFWYDMPTIEKLITVIKEKLSHLDPSHAAEFTQAAAHFRENIVRIKEREAKLKAKMQGRAILVTEPAPLYMLEAAGFINKTPHDFSEAVENGREAPLPVVNETLQLATSGKVAFLAYNEQTMDAQSKKLCETAQNHQLPLLSFTEILPPNTTYLEWMNSNIDRLEKVV